RTVYQIAKSQKLRAKHINQGFFDPSKWSIHEIRRLVVKIIQAQIRVPHILRWSVFRRAHQAAVYLSRIKIKTQL
ncbi:hypothetical protein, partial [Gluconobacter cerinus]|uniref:hypothetical protein n=1 Tax=Gluconobacter cerinus TaxID=38307 RepID=UPI001B8D736D